MVLHYLCPFLCFRRVGSHLLLLSTFPFSLILLIFHNHLYLEFSYHDISSPFLSLFIILHIRFFQSLYCIEACASLLSFIPKDVVLVSTSSSRDDLYTYSRPVLFSEGLANVSASSVEVSMHGIGPRLSREKRYCIRAGTMPQVGYHSLKAGKHCTVLSDEFWFVHFKLPLSL